MKTLEEYHHSEFQQLYLLAFAMVKDEDIAQEIVADAFIALNAKLSLLTSDMDVLAFLAIAVRSNIIKHLKSSQCLN